MSTRRKRRFAVLTLCLMLAVPAPVAAITAIDRAEQGREDAARTLSGLRRLLRTEMNERKTDITLAQVVEARGIHVMHDARTQVLDQVDRDRRRRSRATDRLRRRLEHRMDILRARRDRLGRWLDQLTFRVCPVEGFTQIYDDFGEMVRLPGVPVHVHQGNDITAPTGAPIRAPFDGYATSSVGELGGLSVQVAGVDGYVYNAHLSALGRLGWVRAGTIIGYVGATGDATAPHNHLEWHPNDGRAVDPYPLLAQACLPV